MLSELALPTCGQSSGVEASTWPQTSHMAGRIREWPEDCLHCNLTPAEQKPGAASQSGRPPFILISFTTLTDEHAGTHRQTHSHHRRCQRNWRGHGGTLP